MNGFLTLPIDLHKTLGDYLDCDDLSHLSKTSRHLSDIYGPTLQSHLRLDGTEELLRFLAYHLPYRQGEEEKETSVLTNPRIISRQLDHDASDSTPMSRVLGLDCPHVRRKRLLRVRHVVIHEPGVVWRGPQEWRVEQLFAQIDRCAISEAAGGPLGAVLALCPNMVTLKVLQTPLAFMPNLAHAMVASSSQLRSFTFHSPHVDAEALAHAVAGLPQLHTLDISGVKTCGCRGQEGSRAGAWTLAKALRGSDTLRRLVFTSSKTLSADNGALLRIVAGPLGEPAVEARLRLSSLELRRSPVRGDALAALLRSPACRELRHLFVGGCKRVRGHHVFPCHRRRKMAAASAPYSEAADGRMPIELALDGALLPTSHDEPAFCNVRRLRVFAPRDAHVKALLRLIRSGQLPELVELVILPCSDEIDDWLDGKAGARADLVEALASSCGPSATLQVGDGQWWRVRGEKLDMVKLCQRSRDGDGCTAVEAKEGEGP